MYRLIIDWIDRIAARRGAGRLLPRGLARNVAQFVHDRENNRSVSRALAGRKANLDTIETFLCAHPTSLRVPLVLVSQAQRSGGTLLSQLFDGHPAVAAHPHELALGHLTGEDWPRLDPAFGAEKNFRMLFDIGTLGLMRLGYTKGKRNAERHRFFLVPRLQYCLFRHLFESAPPADAREVLDHFFTAYFNAWLNYQGNLEEKVWITAFAPRLALTETSVAGFFDSYPDGRLIQIIRDPVTWYASAVHHHVSVQRKMTPEQLLELWCASAESMLRNRGRYGDSVIVLRFEDLIARIQDTMQVLTRKLSIPFAPILAEPTFNGRPIRANSSFAVEASGIIRAPLSREILLPQEKCELIERRCQPLYERALAQALAIEKRVMREPWELTRLR